LFVKDEEDEREREKDKQIWSVVLF